MFKTITLAILMCFLACYVKAQEKNSSEAEIYSKMEASKKEQEQIVEKLNKFRKNKKFDGKCADIVPFRNYLEKTISGRDISNIDSLRIILRKSRIFDYNIEFVQANYSDIEKTDISSLQKTNLKLAKCLADTTFNRIIAFQNPQNNKKVQLLFLKSFVQIEREFIFCPAPPFGVNITTESTLTLSGISFKEHIKFSLIREDDLPKLLGNRDYYYSIANETPLKDKHFSINSKFKSGYIIIIWDDNKEIITIYQ